MKIRAMALMRASTSSSFSCSSAMEYRACSSSFPTTAPPCGSPNNSTQAQVRERGREPENSVHCQSQDGAERLKGSRPGNSHHPQLECRQRPHCMQTFYELLKESEVVLLRGSPPGTWLCTAEELTEQRSEKPTAIRHLNTKYLVSEQITIRESALCVENL